MNSVSLLRLLVVPCLSAGFTSLQAGTADSEKAVVTSTLDAPWGGPVLGGGIKSNDAFTEGSLFMVYPFLDTLSEGGSMEGTVGYLEPYATWAESGEVGLSLGLGFRHLFSGQSVADALSVSDPGLFGEGVFVGANLFLDYAQSAFENDFWQGGIGVEAGTRYVEVRGNFYLPFTDDQTIGRFTETEIERRSSDTSRRVFGAPTTQGGQVVRSVSDRTTTTTYTTTTHTTYELFEEALQGWDVEVAVLVPGLDKYMDLRLIAGYYDFSGDRSPSEIEGYRVGAELRPIPALVIHGTWFESDRLYQENWLAGVRVELPLENLGDALKIRRRHLAERLFEPVRRKNSAITTGGVEVDPISTTTTTTTSQSTSTSPAGTQVIGTVPSGGPGLGGNGNEEEGGERGGIR